MRSIPAALKEKLKNQFKVESTDSMAKLRVVATQTSVNSLLSEPIHEDIAPALGDVAVRQMSGDKDLSLAYALCLDDGIATMYMRKFRRASITSGSSSSYSAERLTWRWSITARGK